MKTVKLYELSQRSIAEIEEDLAKAKKMKVQTEPTAQHLFYNIPYGEEYKKLIIKDFEHELHLAKIRDAAREQNEKDSGRSDPGLDQEQEKNSGSIEPNKETS